jgi:uncharacterized protein YijF (DUF1287 family)
MILTMRKLLSGLALIVGPLLAGALHAGAVPSRLTEAAREQVGVTVIYDPSYTRLEFPGGDLPRDRGVCTDVVIRALRDGWGIDLQLAVNRDMTADFAAYPAFWGLSAPDRNIDHRRVPNLQTLLARIGAEVPLSEGPTPFLPGDIVTWTLPGNHAHMGIVSDRLGPDGAPLVLHNMGEGAQEEDILFAYPMTGHYRIGAAEAARLKSLTE